MSASYGACYILMSILNTSSAKFHILVFSIYSIYINIYHLQWSWDLHLNRENNYCWYADIQSSLLSKVASMHALFVFIASILENNKYTVTTQGLQNITKHHICYATELHLQDNLIVLTSYSCIIVSRMPMVKNTF